jgi:transcriptional regulator with XRE-family HTH domain
MVYQSILFASMCTDLYQSRMTANQFRAARALLNVTLADMASAANLGFMTVVRLEHGTKISAKSVEAVRQALYRQGVELIDDDGTKGEGVRFIKSTEMAQDQTAAD